MNAVTTSAATPDKIERLILDQVPFYLFGAAIYFIWQKKLYPLLLFPSLPQWYAIVYI